jgi:hypothetical protein
LPASQAKAEVIGFVAVKIDPDAASPPSPGRRKASIAAGQVSPDGHWSAYRSGDSPHYEIYISSFPDPTGRFQVASVGGWLHDGGTMAKHSTILPHKIR